MNPRALLPVSPALLAALAVVLVLPTSPPPARAQMAGHGSMAMSDAAMQRQVDAWFATHPARGENSTDAPADSFIAVGFVFDRDGNTSTVVDTAHITFGQTILFKWVSGSHTVTSGTGSLDPDVGKMFDKPFSSAAANFAFAFDTVGTFPFFCRIHEGLNMRGVVVVAPALGVEPVAGVASRLGFVGGPFPNPTRGGADFRFALSTPGRAVAEVFDVRGRRVAVALDRELGPGTWRAGWDGSTTTGARAPAGVYYVRLRIPGATQSRRLVLER